MTRPRDRTRRALSLIEMLVTLAVTGMLLGGVAGMLGVVLRLRPEVEPPAPTDLIRQHIEKAFESALWATVLEDANGQGVMLWMRDADGTATLRRQNQRWVDFDVQAGRIVATVPRLPSELTQINILWLQRERQETFFSAAEARQFAGHAAVVKIPILGTGAAGEAGEYTMAQASLHVIDRGPTRVLEYTLRILDGEGKATDVQSAVVFPRPPDFDTWAYLRLMIR